MPSKGNKWPSRSAVTQYAEAMELMEKANKLLNTARCSISPKKNEDCFTVGRSLCGVCHARSKLIYAAQVLAPTIKDAKRNLRSESTIR